MSIAQHFVAGEGEAHPCSAENQNTDSDTAARAEYTCDSTNLPWIIFRATFRASHVDGLSTRARAVLAALARTIDAKRPYASVYARRNLLTDRSMQSMRTFYRSLADLEAAGLIHRPPQSRYVDAGLFGRAYLHLTEKAAILLGLVEAPPVKPIEQAPDDSDSSTSDAPARLQDHSSTNLAPAILLGLVEAPPVKLIEPAPDDAGSSTSDAPARLHDHPSANVAHGAIYKNLYPSSFQKRQPGQLPSDLERLRSLGFREFLIFRLMREAREQGKFLSDVVELTWEHLKRAHAPINYLRSLLQSPTDFGYQLRTKKEAEDRIKQVQREAINVRTAVHDCAGKVFFDSDERRIVVSTDAQLMTVHDWREATPRVAGGVWQVPFVKALHGGSIRVASSHDEKTFADRLNARLNKASVPASVHVESTAASQTAAHEAQMKLKDLLKGTRMSRPFARVAGRQ